MKKIIWFGMGILLLIPSLSLAQTINATSSKEALIASLYSLLQVLENEIQAIITQQNQIQSIQATQTQQIEQMAQNAQPTVGAISDPQDIPTSQASISITVQNLLTYNGPETSPFYTSPDWVASNEAQYPFGYYYLQAEVLDANGNPIKAGTAGGDTPISMTVTGQTTNAIIDTVYGQDSTKTGYHMFTFSPTAPGTYLLIFSSGNLSATTTIVATANATSNNQ